MIGSDILAASSCQSVYTSIPEIQCEHVPEVPFNLKLTRWPSTRSPTPRTRIADGDSHFLALSGQLYRGPEENCEKKDDRGSGGFFAANSGGDKNVPSTVPRRFSQKRPPTVAGGPEGSPVQLARRLNRSILPRRTPIPRRERERSHPSSNAANRGGKPGQLAIRRIPGLRRSCVNAA